MCIRDRFMAYFLKKNRKKDKLYLSIVNSYYDSERKQTVHSTYESFGTGQALIDQGISDPIAYLEDMVLLSLIHIFIR